MNISSNVTWEVPADDNRVMRIVVYSLLIASGVICNALIIILFTRNRQLRKSINFYILNMAISVLFVLIFSASVRLAQNISNSQNWKVNGSFGLFLCKSVNYFSDLSPLVSTFCLVFMSLDRFLAVVYPTKRHWRSKTIRRQLIIVSWAIPLLYCLKGLYSNTVMYSMCGEYWGPSFARHSTILTIIKVFHSIVFILVPLVIITVLYSCILWTLRKQHRHHARTILCHYQQQLRQRQRKKINILAFSIVLAFGVCHGPLHFFIYISFCFTNWNAPSGLLRKAIFPATSLAYANATITPLICILFNTEIRKAFKEMLFCNIYRNNKLTSSCKWKLFNLRGSYELKPLDIGHISTTMTTTSANYLHETEESVRIYPSERYASSLDNKSYIVSNHFSGK